MSALNNPKPRIQEKLSQLPVEQRERLNAWLREGLTYKEVEERLATQFGVKTASSSLSNYYKKHLSQIASAVAVRSVRTGENGPLEFEIILRVQVRSAELIPIKA